ncbi:hypothetical protein ACOCJ7_14100 [Knoellia sp. CPCC 206453]|uniref:hypothetical protein n=1 Tax=Knoellia pratensis TaxID=3404796 RepID=UPI003607172D
MSYQPPLPPGPGPGPGAGYGPGPHAYYGQPTQGAPPPYGAHPAYLGMPSPAPQSTGLNPWIAGLIGVICGGVLTVIGMTVIPMILFGFLLGGPMGDEGFMEGPHSVTVAADGSVSGVALADALEDGEWYEDMTCPNTATVATDVTTICEGTDGFADLRVVVVFRGTDGRFGTADLFE